MATMRSSTIHGLLGGLAAVLFVAGTGQGCASQTTIEGATEGAGGGDPGGGGAGGGANGATATTGPAGGSAPGPCTVEADCLALSDACNAGACVNGACEKLPANDLAACDDGLFCTQSTSCQGGVCGGGTTTSCPSGGDPCQIGSCDEATDRCSSAPGNDGNACDDGDACTLSGTCSAGSCLPGPPVDCSFLDDICGVGACDPQLGCVKQPLGDGAPCDDGQFCTVSDTCNDGVCGGAPNTCAAPGDVCLIGSCSEQTDSCVAVPGPDGVACDDANACTSGEACSAGLCAGGAPVNQGSPCDDGDACTSGETCSAGACLGAPIVACASGDGCCPPGCTDAVDGDCTCEQNLALAAVADISDGGSSAPYTPGAMNDGEGQSSCVWSWVSNGTAPTGAWAELTWGQPVTIGSFYVDTEHGTQPAAGCANPQGRNLFSAKVQWWNGASWIDATSFTGQLDDVQIDLVPAVTTTRLRLFDMTTSPGNGNTILYEWHVFQSPGCVP